MKIQQQRGAVLIISMIILLLLTILGVTSMRTTQLEERMAGNARDRHVAFEAAEAALIDAETYIQTIVIPPYVLNGAPFDLNGADGLYSDDTTLVNIENYIDWSGAIPARGFLTATSIDTSQGVNTASKYVIQRLAQGSIASSNLNPSVGGGYGPGGAQNTSNNSSALVRITARGTGGSDNSIVFLQTVFGL